MRTSPDGTAGEYFEVWAKSAFDLNGLSFAITNSSTLNVSFTSGAYCAPVAANTYLVVERNGDASLNGGLPPAAGCYYIHDLALLPAARGRGVARRVVRALTAMSFSLGLPEMALVAVGGSAGFWAAQGFVALELPELVEKLASYDADARYMRRAVGVFRPAG